MSRELLQRVLKVLKVKRLRLDEHLIPIIVEEIEAELADLDPPFELTDAGADTNIEPFQLHPKGSGMVTLNQLEQEPVAWLPKWAHDRLTGQLGSVSDPVTWGINTHIYAKSTPETIPLYTAPLRKEWVGLTDEEIELLVSQARKVPVEIPCDSFTTRLLKLGEQILKDKNT